MTVATHATSGYLFPVSKQAIIFCTSKVFHDFHVFLAFFLIFLESEAPNRRFGVEANALGEDDMFEAGDGSKWKP